MSLKELPLPSIASLRAIAALKSPHLALVRPARIGLGFESAGANQKTLAEVEATLGGPGRLSLSYSLRWLLDILTGLGVLHRALSFVHGEVQPENVVLGDDGVGRIIPVVRAHWVRGEERSPEHLYYLAPEKLLGDSVDVRADVFSVGVMLWEALAGQRLIEAYTVDDIIARLMGGGIPRAQAPEGEAWTAPLSAIAERAIAIDPARRFASVAEMKAAIEGACQRYLASAPGMAELFGNPEARARNHVRDSLPPDSQRVTLPPDKTASELPSAPNEAELDAAAERLSRTSFVPPELDEELTTTRNAVPVPLPEPDPLPHVRRGKHVNTLLGVPLPAIENREPSAPDSVTLPFAKLAASTAPPVVIPTISPSASEPPPAPLPFGKTRQQFGIPEATRPEDRIRAVQVGAGAPTAIASAPPAAFAERADSPAPLVAEPSFELVRPRKGRAALWLVLGAAAAVGLFAARPWLAQQVAAATGADTTVPVHDESQPQAAQSPTTPKAGVEVSASAPAISIASTPPAPSSKTNAARTFGGPREEHVVIHDRLEPDVSPPTPAEPVAAPEPPKKEPAAEPPPAPVVAPPAPKPKPVPVSDADRYGI